MSFKRSENTITGLQKGRHSSVVTGVVPDDIVGTVQVSLRHSSDAVQGPFRRHSDADEKRNLHALLRRFQTSELKTPFGIISIEDPVLVSSPIGEVVWQHCAATRMLPASLKDWSNAVLKLRMIRMQGTLGLLGCSIYIN